LLPVVNALCLGTVLYRSGLVPRILPLIGLFLVIQRFWSLDLLSGSVKA